jgi:F420-non-reducing hydrogenase iron-sulfur subunit
MTEFSPKILAFCCNYCAYAAADLAGTSRMQYPTNVRIIRVPCSGKVDITYLLRAFETGADGVIVAGCLEGGCHFIEGNLHAKARVNFAKDILNAIGINGNRLEMFNISSAMAPQFVKIIEEMTARITKLGPAFPKKLSLTERRPEDSKREFLYQLITNLALKKPEKPILVPEKLQEFGTIEQNLKKCIGCKKCEEVCPEKAIEFTREFDLPAIFESTTETEEGKVTKRRLLYETIVKVAVKPASKAIPVPEGLSEFSKMQYKLKKCVTCDKCEEICPEKAISIRKELDLSTIFA